MHVVTLAQITTDIFISERHQISPVLGGCFFVFLTPNVERREHIFETYQCDKSLEGANLVPLARLCLHSA